jgi:hypothetical protein
MCQSQTECDALRDSCPAEDNDETEEDQEDEDDKAEPWEEEIHETLQPQVEIRGWNLLCDQIKKDLKAQHLTLPLSQINQLMILRNFATLRLKGHGRIAASLEIALQWHEKDEPSTHFACRIRALARSV